MLPTDSNWAGELLAINEFNAEREMRKIEQYRFLRLRRIFKNARWIDQIFILPSFQPFSHQAAARTARDAECLSERVRFGLELLSSERNFTASSTG